MATQAPTVDLTLSRLRAQADVAQLALGTFERHLASWTLPSATDPSWAVQSISRSLVEEHLAATKLALARLQLELCRSLTRCR